MVNHQQRKIITIQKQQGRVWNSLFTSPCRYATSLSLRKERDVLATPKQGEVESTLFLQSVPYPFNRCSLQKHKGRVVNPPLQHEGQVVNLPLLFTSPCRYATCLSLRKERDVLATPKQGEVESTLFLQSVPYPSNPCSLQKHKGRVVNPPL